MRDKVSKNSRGFAYVSFYKVKDAENAKTQANHHKLLKQEIRVTWKKDLKSMDKEAAITVRDLDESVTS